MAWTEITRGRYQRDGLRHASGKSPLHMVGTWGCGQRLVLAQIATNAKSNAITAVPKLLALQQNQDTRHNNAILSPDDPARQVTTVATAIGWLQELHRWPNLATIGKVHRLRETASKTMTGTACFVPGTPLSPEWLNEVVGSQ